MRNQTWLLWNKKNILFSKKDNLEQEEKHDHHANVYR